MVGRGQQGLGMVSDRVDSTQCDDANDQGGGDGWRDRAVSTQDALRRMVGRVRLQVGLVVAQSCSCRVVWRRPVGQNAFDHTVHLSGLVRTGFK